MTLSLSNLKRRRVLVTGATGFLGRNVMRQLAILGSDVVGVSRAPADPSDTWEIVQSDLLADSPAALLKKMRPDVIIHCAGLGREPRSLQERTHCWDANYTITERLLNAASERTTPPRFVMVSSAAIYAPMAPQLSMLDETSSWRPLGYYGTAKAAATMLAHVMNKQGAVPIAIGVPFNLIGPGQPSHLVPQDFIRRLKTQSDRLDVGNLSAVRDWVDVRDAASALISLASEEVPTDIYNIASGRGLAVQDLLDRIVKMMDISPEIVISQAVMAQVGTSRSIGNPAKYLEITKSTLKYSLDESLAAMLK